MSEAARVFLVDDQAAVRNSLARLMAVLGFDVSSFASAQEFLDSSNAAAPGCLLLDLSMPGMNGLALQQELSARGSLLPVIFLTGHGDVHASVQAMKGGAVDFLTKPVDDGKLLDAVRAALEKNRQARLAHAERDQILSRMASLTQRESEVMALLVEGLLNKQIAAELGAAEKTIKVHRARVMTKMQVRSLTELVRLTDRVARRKTAGQAA